MLLVLDCGNSRIKAAVLESSTTVHETAFVPTSQALNGSEELSSLLGRLAETYPLTRSCAVTVVPGMHNIITDGCTRYRIPLTWFDPALQSRLLIDYENPGADRVAACYGAVCEFPSRTLTILDCGTAITLDRVRDGRIFEGGYIIPGMQTAADALHHATNLIPKITMHGEQTHIGKNTCDCIRSGLTLLYRGGIRTIADRMLDGQTDSLCVITGGASLYILDILAGTQCVHRPNLIFSGLYCYMTDIGHL